MAEIPNHQIVDAKEDLERLLSDSRKAPVKLVYASKKNHRKISEEAEELEDFRMELLTEYAKTGEEGHVVQKTDEDGNPTGEAEFESDEKLREFRERLSEIWSETVDIDIHSVHINQVGDYVAPANWGQNLDFMFEGFENAEVELQGGKVQASADSIETILGMKDGMEETPELPLKFSAALFQTYQDLVRAQREIETRRFELLSEYAEKDEEGNIVTREDTNNAKFPDEETQSEFREKLNEVYDEDFTIDATLVEVDYTDGVELHPRHTIILDWMLTD